MTKSLGLKWRVLTGLMWLMMTSCQQITSSYTGDGELTRLLGCVEPPLYQIQMLPIDISKPQNQRYKLTGLPPSERMYRVALIVSSAEFLSGRKTWGECVFQLHDKEKRVKIVRSRFSDLNDQFPTRNQVYANGLYHPTIVFRVQDHRNPWDLTFECAGFASSEPVWAYLLICSEGK